MKDIITPIRPYIIHDFKQVAILVKTNEQIFVLVLWHKAVYQRKRQRLEYIFLGYFLVL
jgi:hypothetical protein